MGNNNFMITFCLYDSVNVSSDGIIPYLFGNLNGLAGLEKEEKRVIENV